MSETWKGKTRGGIFGYMFFIYMIRCLGITAAYGFLALVVLYFIPFAPKATGNTWSYARNRLKYGRLKSVALLLTNYYRLGQILIDKVAIGNGMTGKYHFKFENYQAFLDRRFRFRFQRRISKCGDFDLFAQINGQRRSSHLFP